MKPTRKGNHPFFAAGAVLLAHGALFAQQYVISTLAGGAPPPSPIAASAAAVVAPQAVAADNAGNVYFISSNCAFQISPAGMVTQVAGNSRLGYSGDGASATNARFSSVAALALDAAGNLYFADEGNNVIRRTTSGGTIASVAGNLVAGYAGDHGPAIRAELNGPQGIAVDPGGDLYIADANNAVIRKVTPDGMIATIAGTGATGYSGDNGQAIAAQLSNPAGLALDAAGNLYIADTGNNRIRKVAANGTITTIAGNGSKGYSGDGQKATAASLNHPQSVAIDGNGNLYFADSGNNAVRIVSSSGVITTFAGGAPSSLGDGGPAASASLSGALGVAVGSNGTVYIADTGNNRIRAVISGVISTLAGDGTFGSLGDGGPALRARLVTPHNAVADGNGNVYIADTVNSRIRKVSPDGTIATLAGNGTDGYAGDGGPAAGAVLNQPWGLVVDNANNLYIADKNNNRVRKIAPDGSITTIAGNGTAGYTGDGGQATSAELNSPWNLALDSGGNLYIADTLNNCIRQVAPNGTITTVAGNGQAGYSGDGGSATSAELNFPLGVAIDSASNLYITDSGNVRIRKVTPNGQITTLAGGGTATSDGVPATTALLDFPVGIAADSAGNVYFADPNPHKIRQIDSGGIITTVAGNGNSNDTGDGGLASGAGLELPMGVSIDPSGKFYIGDEQAAEVRLLTPTNQSVLISAVLDAASESAVPVTPGKIVVLYGAGLGPSPYVINGPSNGVLGPTAGGSTVFFNGVPAALIYAAPGQLSAIAPYEIAGSSTAVVTVTSSSGTSAPYTVQVAPSAPSFFSSNGTGSGQIAAVNVDYSLNDPTHPVAIGGYVSLFATGEGVTSPSGADGLLAPLQPPYPAPVLPVSVTVGGIEAPLPYAGAAPTEVEGLMQVVIQIPPGVQPGGYAPVVLKVGDSSTVDGAAWIAVSAQ